MDSKTKALRLFTLWHDGAASDRELISGLAELPYEVIGAMPDGETKNQVLELRGADPRYRTSSVAGGRHGEDDRVQGL